MWIRRCAYPLTSLPNPEHAVHVTAYVRSRPRTRQDTVSFPVWTTATRTPLDRTRVAVVVHSRQKIDVSSRDSPKWSLKRTWIIYQTAQIVIAQRIPRRHTLWPLHISRGRVVSRNGHLTRSETTDDIRFHTIDGELFYIYVHIYLILR